MGPMELTALVARAALAAFTALKGGRSGAGPGAAAGWWSRWNQPPAPPPLVAMVTLPPPSTLAWRRRRRRLPRQAQRPAQWQQQEKP